MKDIRYFIVEGEGWKIEWTGKKPLRKEEVEKLEKAWRGDMERVEEDRAWVEFMELVTREGEG